MRKENFDFRIPNLGPAKYKSPISLSTVNGDHLANFVRDDDHILYDINADRKGHTNHPAADRELIEKSGPREKIYFQPHHVHAAIVTCGGLCPGLNDVVRAIVRCLWTRYGVRRITGLKFGYRGLMPEYALQPIDLNPGVVENIHKMGGTFLGSSRGGGEKIEETVDALEQMNINMLFTIGGDGTQKGSLRIADEVERRGHKIAVVGVPKTIDNDLSFTQRSFGFETAVSRAVESVFSAHTEAKAYMNGVGLVRVMGRESGFIACAAALASHEANYVLIPEVPFDLEGPKGFLPHLLRRVREKGHAVIIVAEGAGQSYLIGELGKDASGNKKLKDIGIFLRDRVIEYFAREKTEIAMKYIDPSYLIRSSTAIATDSIYCERLGNDAVHAAMAGKTKCIVTLLHNTHVHIPIKLAVSRRNFVDPESDIWRDVLETTHQPASFVNDAPATGAANESTASS